VGGTCPAILRGSTWERSTWERFSVIYTLSKSQPLITYLHIVQKWTKNQCEKLKKFKISIQDFCPRNIESSHLGAASAWNYGR